ncbi:probable tubulin polyglutamylase TTLL2 [Sarcophilus harrisii]|uniref:Tubulin tyrosine ligase like 2 n=1 Tax=Sarcophilus harrisii TaxID=9305 RepID=G3WK28_SARHA|nr:probable tubulin polyglutamylase TTLL2 [Sarcophilus harrisii]XP_031793357.1 probable tubulin polyglutamylase TTLL2 [Sarcophilus harrisii]
MMTDENSKILLKPLVFRADDYIPEVVKNVLLERGWNKYNEDVQEVADWNLYWRTSAFCMTDHNNVKPWQRLNHHPGTTRLTRKDYLARHLKHMKGIYGASLYAFSPLTYIMPNDYIKFVAEYSREKETLGTKPSYWICKPAELSRGRGIMIFSDLKDLNFDCATVVQKYISNPFLIAKYKSDLRIYVCVAGFQPLTIYLYQEGLVRFATEKFDLNNLKNKCAHLTNSSVNKTGASYKKNKEGIGRGCKWTLSRFFTYLRNQDVDVLLLWQKINHLVILTILSIAPSVPSASNCFELFGFDILIDDKFKPWLLEVNCSPGLSLDCSSDVSVKRKLIHDIIELMHFKQICLDNTKKKTDEASSHRSHISWTGGDKVRVHESSKHWCKISWAEGKKDRDLETSGQWTNISQFGQKNRIHTLSGYTSHYKEPSKILSLLEFRGIVYKANLSVLQENIKIFPKEMFIAKPKERKAKDSLPAAFPKIRNIQTTFNSFHHSPSSESCKKKKNITPNLLSDKGTRPCSCAGDFVLIFPFNEATLAATKKGLDIKKVIHEIQKFVNKQPTPEAEDKTKKT